MSLTVIWSGVDTLEASFRGGIADTLVAKLDELKALAQEWEQPQEIEIAGYPLCVQAQGLKPYRYLLTGEDLHVRISPSGTAPSVSVRLLSLGLLAQGHNALYDLAARIAHACGIVGSIGLSRLDLACDFQGYVPTYEDSLRIVCPAVFRPIYPNTANPETFQFGKEQIVVRIYNKTREIAQSGKGYWQHVWAVNPDYDPTRDVWRFELQLRRQALDELGCREPQEALASLDRLFAYGLEWANLRIPSGQSTDRWQEDPAWGELRAALFLGEPVARVKSVSYVGGTAKLVPMAAGLLVSVAARLGIARLDRAFAVLQVLIEDYFESRNIDFELEVSKRQVKMDGSRKELQSV